MITTVMLATISLQKNAGGLEKNIVYLSNELIASGKRVVLLTFDFADAEPFYELNPELTWVKIGITEPHTKMSISQKLELVGSIRKNIKAHKVDQIICFTHGILARFLLANLGLNTTLVCSERNSISMYKHTTQKKWNVNFMLLIFVKKITVQFDAYKYDYPIWLRHKIFTVNNPIFYHLESADLSSKNILAVGRLATQKQYHILIEAFALVAKDWPDWQLKIIGEGHLKLELLDLIKTLKLDGSVMIIPPSKLVENHYQTSSIFAISSQWEGFPNALAEAMSFGMLGVGFDQTAGVSDLISNGKNGILAYGPPSKEALAKAICTLLTLREDWPEMSVQSKKISRKFSVLNWRRQWVDILGR